MSEKPVECVSYDDDDDDDDNYEDYEDLENVEIVKIKGLFNEEKWFDDVQSLYKYEFENNNFNLIKIIKKYQMNMLSYIKMINFIRKNVSYTFAFY